jgi:hypothetical protein
VQVTVRTSGIVVEYENRAFRNELTALGVVLGAAAEAAQADAEIVAVPRRRDVPVIAVIADAGPMRRFMQGESMRGGLRAMLRVSQDVRRFTRPQAGDEETRLANRSRGQLDLTAEPHLTYQLGQAEDPFWADLLLQPGAEVQLGRGMLAGVRGDVILDRGEARWDRAYVSHVMRPGDRRLVLASTVGQVAPRLGAWHAEGLLASDDDRFRLGASFTLLGRHLFDLDAGVHSRSTLGVAEYEVQPLDLTLRASGGRFLFGDEGGRLDAVRRFGERELTLTTICTDLGDRWAFSLRLPLGPAKLPPPRCGRLRWAEAWEVGYHSTIADLGGTIDYDFSLTSFRDELSGPYLLAHPEELRGGVPALKRAGVLQADVPARAAWEQTSSRQQPPWPSLLGRSGLVFIPTADTLGDGQYAFGASLIDRRHTILHGRSGGRTASIPPYVGFGFLPGVEIGMRYTIYPSLHAYDWGYSTNRAPYAHVRLLRERGHRPGVAAFVEDPTGASVEKAYGLAVSQRFAGAEWTAGCGEGRFDGLFGGVSRAIGSHARVMAEYDSRFVNLGAGARLDHLLVQGALLGFDGAACGVSFWGRF